MKQLKRITATAAVMLLLAGCAENPESDIIVHKDMDKVIGEAQQTDDSNRDYCALPGNTAELSDCYELYDSGRTIFMNPTAFSDFCGDDTQSPVLFHGTLDGKPYAAQIVCTPNLPKTEAFAAVAVGEAELRDADTLRLCPTDRAAFSPESIGLTVQNPEVQTAAAYEEQLVLLRIRFAAFAVFFAMVAAGAFLHIYKLQHKNA